MKDAGILEPLRQVIEADQVPLPAPAQAMAEAIRAKHGPAVRAMIFYGSALREGEAAEKMLDFYVIVGNYRAVYGRGLKSLGAWLLPPNVHFMALTDAAGNKLRSKYAVISEAAFMRRAGGGSLESMLWARFSQPVVIVAEDPVLRARLIEVLAKACRHFAAQVTPLLSGPLAPEDIWQRGLQESYRTELRPESPGPRAAEIAARFPERYARLSQIIAPQGEVPDAGRLRRAACRIKWALRRIIGKPLGMLRVLKAATTFDAGLDYILEKVASHSGVELEVSAAERRHPVLHAPKLAWRLYRAGAFR
jgi:predicted nucleotidyltransferase